MNCPRCNTPLVSPDAVCVPCSFGLALSPATATEDPHQKVIRYFGDFELLELLAEGGSATVWRARQTSLQREVALKLLKGGLLAGPVEQARFRQEAETVARLEHPGIVDIFEVGEHEGSPYLALRYLPGGSLAQARGRFAVDPRAAATLVARVARAVHHAHQRGLIHRDLKPANILLEPDGSPLVADFGLARRLDTERSLTAANQLVGTLAYMAPEQAAGQPVSVATDVWSLGVILYELLAGRSPFAAGSTPALLKKIAEDEPPSMGKVSRDLKAVIRKCLEKEAIRRYDSARELAEDLENWLAGKPVRARPVAPPERVWKWLRRHPWQTAFFALLPLPFAVALGYLLLLNWLASEHYVVQLPSGEVSLRLPISEESGNRCTSNFDQRPFQHQPRKVRLEFGNVPPDLAPHLVVRIRGDRAGWPDTVRSLPLTNGQTFTLVLPEQSRFIRERNLYFATEGWTVRDLRRRAPESEIRLTILE
ncbi:MAG TPA: serine/threonine-protein kinase [Verrucomicrobiota bacterium]|nr:hypothetical protein [Verrucomicrobiales bacterium]HRI11667.1 serine/threonine-protein kinase [Verrucomicrobiota bacterium]